MNTLPSTYIIDAKGKAIGRIASEAAMALMGKKSPSYRRNIASDVSVTIVNASKAKIDERKMKEKEYKTYSGYPGGLKSEPLEALAKRRGYGEIFTLAVYGMLPSNRLRPIRMKKLTVTE